MPRRKSSSGRVVATAFQSLAEMQFVFLAMAQVPPGDRLKYGRNIKRKKGRTYV
jgi:hypothetical protein